VTVHGDGTQTRDFVHVDDIVRANVLAAETDDVGRAFNVGSGTETSIRELAETVTGVVDTDSEVVHVDGRAGDIEHSVADLEAAKRSLGYQPQVTLADGLPTVIDADD
jgi:UDP-glucose 4-epimerase